MKEVNVFICHNPFHHYITNQLCKDKFVSQGYRNIIVSPVSQTKKGTNVSYIVTKSGFIKKLISSWRIKLMILDFAMSHGENLQIFLPHADGLIGNYVLQSKKLLKANVKVSFYYEGIVMLDEGRMDRKFPRFLWQKKLFSYLLLYNFQVLSDILPMDSQRIYKVYTPYPEKTPAPKSKKVGISFTRERIDQVSEGILVVGVDAGESLEDSFKGLIKFIYQRKNQETTYFKAHYADKQKVFERLAEQANFPYKFVKDVRCIEEIIGDLPVNTVIGIHLSSALLNLKLIYKEELEVFFLAHSNTIAALGAENVNLAISLGVKIINLKDI